MEPCAKMDFDGWNHVQKMDFDGWIHVQKMDSDGWNHVQKMESDGWNHVQKMESDGWNNVQNQIFACCTQLLFGIWLNKKWIQEEQRKRSGYTRYV